jgi:hypothetical protein
MDRAGRGRGDGIDGHGPEGSMGLQLGCSCASARRLVPCARASVDDSGRNRPDKMWATRPRCGVYLGAGAGRPCLVYTSSVD